MNNKNKTIDIMINLLEIAKTNFEKQDKVKIKKIDKRIESQYKDYISKLRDTNRKAKDFEMTN